MSGADAEHGLSADQWEQLSKIRAAQGDATLGRRETAARDVEEDGAAAAPNARAVVVAEDDDDVVELILAPHTLGACGIGVGYGAIVIAIARRIAPAVLEVCRAQWQPCAWPDQPIGPKISPLKLEATERRRPVSFAFQGLAAAAAKSARKAEMAGSERAGRRPTGENPHEQLTNKDAL